MAFTGNWKANQEVISGALKQGTGWNPVHAISSLGEGRAGEEPKLLYPGGVTNPGPIDPKLTPYDPTYTYGFTDEDRQADYEWTNPYTPRDYDAQDRAGYGEGENRATVDSNFPSWGDHGGFPGGAWIRHQEVGVAEKESTQTPALIESVTEGWRNKVHHDPFLDAKESDPSQYDIQTARVQLPKDREGSQAKSGRASEYLAPIQSRKPGPKMKFFSGGQRHYDMLPKAQDLIIRPFWNRSAGVGPVGPEWNQSNDAWQYQRGALTRTSPDNPDAGPVVGNNPDYGYSYEDASMGWY